MINKRFGLLVIAVVVLALVAIAYAGGLAYSSSIVQDSQAANKTEPDEPEISSFLFLKDENGFDIKADSVKIGEKGFSGNGSILLDGAPFGNYTALIRINGVDYEEGFNYNGESVNLVIGQPITTVVYVGSKTGKPMGSAKVYSDGILKCSTDANGICKFYEKAGAHKISLEGDSFTMEKTVETGKDSSSFLFEVERKFPITVKVEAMGRGTLIEDAEVTIDGNIISWTDEEGKVTADVLEGTHNFTVSYNDISESKEVTVEGPQEVSVELYFVPKVVYLSLE